MASRKVRLHRTVSGLRLRSRDRLIRLRDSKLHEIGIDSVRPLISIPVLLGLILLIGFLRMPEVTEKVFRPSAEADCAPLSGWAVRADAWGKSDRIDAQLVYAEATWAELEPENGIYDFEAFEQANHLEKWWAEGKRVILRLTADCPGEAGHKDIPEWLVEMMGGEELAGNWYDSSRGSGFSPDYSSIVMREEHRQLIAAAAERYDGHPGVAYIEIGSLGWNGSWTVNLNEEGVEALPTSTISREYAWHYTSSFSDTLMLMRRPYIETQLLNVGIYQLDLGDFEAAWNDLDQIAMGGYDRQIETDLVAMPEFYKVSPAGAHISESIDLEALLCEGKQELARQIEESHLSYVVLEQDVSGLSDEAIDALDELDDLLGSRIWIRSAEWDSRVRTGMRSKVILRFRNDGAAPMHAGWPVALALFDGEEMICMQLTEADALTIQPGETEATVWIDVPVRAAVGLYELKMAIIDPADGKAGVQLMMKECDRDTLWTSLGELRVIG